MINLEKTSGLPIEMKEDFSLVFGEEVTGGLTSDIREFSAVKPYLKNPSADYHRKDVYHMYRDLALQKDREKVGRSGIQYDITVIPPGKFGDEYAKTIGHYHSVKPGTETRYPEVYEVLYGRVFWLIQSATPELSKLEEAYIIEAGRGDKAVMPPGFGHISINPTEDPLVMANWQPRANESTYEPYEAHQGGAYYVMESRLLGEEGRTSTDYEFVPNLSYSSLPELKRVRPRELPRFGLRTALPMYFTVTQDFETLDFLLNPENYIEELAPNKIFSEI